VSGDLASEMKKFGLNGTYEIIPNVVNTNLFSSKTNTSETFKILHVSNMLDVQKNVSGIIQTISNLQNKIPNLELVLVGEKSNRYEGLVNSLNLKNITFIDQISQKELVEHFHNAHLFVLFSNYENLPCVILESFSTGTPVITTNVGGISEFFPENFGTIIPKNDIIALEIEILNFYNSVKKHETSIEMHNYAEQNFSQKAICDIYTNLYLKTIE
jgi:glycosyltransferase involved in cell wall biosynthesis